MLYWHKRKEGLICPLNSNPYWRIWVCFWLLPFGAAGFLAGKFALAEYEPFTILAFRFLGSALCLGLIFCRSLRHTTKNVAKKGMLLGILQFVGLSVQLAGLDRTTPGKQSFLIASYVMFVPFLSCFLLRKRINGRELLAALLTLAGIGCISLNESLTIGLGEGLSVGFAFLFALQIVLVSIFARNEDPIRLSFFQFLSAGLLAAVTALLTDGIPQSCSLLTLGSLLYLIVPNTVLAFTIQNVAQRYTSETANAILLSFLRMVSQGACHCESGAGLYSDICRCTSFQNRCGAIFEKTQYWDSYSKTTIKIRKLKPSDKDFSFLYFLMKLPRKRLGFSINPAFPLSHPLPLLPQNG